MEQFDTTPFLAVGDSRFRSRDAVMQEELARLVLPAVCDNVSDQTSGSFEGRASVRLLGHGHVAYDVALAAACALAGLPRRVIAPTLAWWSETAAPTARPDPLQAAVAPALL